MQWIEEQDLYLIYDAKDLKTFRSARWQTDTNLDLCIVSTDEERTPLPHMRRVLPSFPRTQHRPVIVTIGIQVPLIESVQKPRWNFRKADWPTYKREMESNIRFVPPKVENYTRFVGLMIASAKRNIPRGHRKQYIPCWNSDTENLYQEYRETNNPQVGSRLLESLNQQRRKRWEETTENLNFTHSSRKSWSLLRRLGAATHIPIPKSTVSPNEVAIHIKERAECVTISKEDMTSVQNELDQKRNTLQENAQFSTPFTNDEVNTAINSLKLRKAAGVDNIFPEFVKHLGPIARTWIKDFFNDILNTARLPNEFKMSHTLAILKPGKSPENPANYRPIALLCICYKLLERMIYNRICPTINEHLPHEQAGFRPNRSCCEQVLALTSYIEAGFQKGLKTSVAFVDLSAAYDTVWIDGLTLKLMKMIPCLKLTRLLERMLKGRYFKVTLGTSSSKSRSIKNGLPQGSVLAPLLFNVYISDTPNTTSRKFCYADDMAIATQNKHLEEGETTITADLETLNQYFQKWRLRPNPNKTETCAFHLNNRMAHRELNVTFCGEPVKHNKHPKYLGVVLDRSLTFKKHLELTCQKLKTRNNIIRKLAGTTWGANAATLRTATQSLVYSVAEYCAPVWGRSSHVNKIDTQLNEAMRVITGTLKSTPLPWLHVLSNIAPPGIRRQQATFQEWQKINHPDQPRMWPIHKVIDEPCVNRLKSRAPIWNLEALAPGKTYDASESWTFAWNNSNVNQHNIEDPNKQPPGMQLPRKTWSLLNRVRTGHAKTRSAMHKWGIADNPACDCGAEEQTLTHIVQDCPLRRFTGQWKDFTDASPAAIAWLSELDLDL